MLKQRPRMFKRLALTMLVSLFLLITVCSFSQADYPSGQMALNRISIYGDFSSKEESTQSGVPDSQYALNSVAIREKGPPVTEKLLVLRARLSGQPFDVPFSTINATMSVGVKSYYLEVSYDHKVISATAIATNYSMSQTAAYYSQSIAHLIELVTDVVTAANSTVAALGGYTSFRHLLIVHSGEDYAMTLSPNDIHSEFVSGMGISLGSETIDNASIVSEHDPIGVVVHELGHSQGLLDLYDYGAPAGAADDFVGAWDLMATGSWNPMPSGTSPAHMTTWCKMILGWINSTQVVSISQASISVGNNVTVLLNPHELTGKTLVIRVTLTNGSYYLVEGRIRIGYDSYLPGSGVLVLYCDPSKGNGEGPVRVISAHPPGLGADAVYNVGWLQEDFFGDSHADIGMKVLNKWDNGTYKVIVGEYTAVFNAASEYVSQSNIPISILIVGAIAILVVVAVVYVKKGRHKPVESGYDKIQVIKVLRRLQRNSGT